MKEKVIKVIEENGAYGYRRLIPELKKKGVIVNHKKLLPLLKKWYLGIRRKIIKKTRSGIESTLTLMGSRVNMVKCLKEKEFNTLGKVIYTDFTEIVYKYGKAKVYLIPYLEHVSKKVIGYAVSKEATTTTVMIALTQATKTLLSWKVDVSKSYFHQDQGSVFKAYEYVGKIVIDLKARISYSRVGTPGDNPEMESFFGRFKVEWRQVFNEAESEDEIKVLISKAIKYYNLKRIHSAHENMSPDEFLKSVLKH